MNACFIYLTKPTPSTPDRIAGVRRMAKILEELGYDRSKCKSVFLTSGDDAKRLPVSEAMERNLARVLSEIGTDPVILVPMGSSAMNRVTKNYYPISLARGVPVPVTNAMPYPKGSLVYGLFDPATVWSDPGCEDLFRKDLKRLVALMSGTPEEDPRVDNVIVHSPEEVRAFSENLPKVWESLPPSERFLVVDCEWHGRNWMAPGHYIRTVQVGYGPGMAMTVELYREHPDFNDDAKWPTRKAERKAKVDECLRNPVCLCQNLPGMWQALKELLQDARYPIVGHNVIADWQWLLTFGVDIRPNVVFDTMLAEHLINSGGPFRLDEVAMRRTPFGRYCADVDLWVHHHKDFCQEGYGAVPASILMPYGGADVECPRRIMHAQMPVLEKYGMLEPRGPESEYPSLLDSTMLNELATDELERNGLPVDRKRLTELIDAYQAMRAQLLSEITLMAMAAGMPDFNPNSQPQMRMLLFGKLGLTPVKTTGGQTWGDAIGNFGMDDEDAPSSSTDKSVLEMLQDKHPLVKKLLQFRRIDQTCKTWLRHPDEDGEGGLEALLWSDGKLHASFLPTTSTGRYKTASPNCFPKEVEVLTENGWMHWDEAYAKKDLGLRLAQWNTESKERYISFAQPDAWHTGRNSLIRVFTDKQLDIAATPDHRFEVFDRKSRDRHKTITTQELARHADYMIPQAGTLAESCGTVHLDDHEVVLICAMQADGHIVHQGGVEFAVTKNRKAIRIRKALDAGGWKYRESHDKNAIGNPRTRFYVGRKNNGLALAKYKFFGDWLLQYDVDTLQRISDEIFNWDGCQTCGTCKNYASSVRENTDWAQILQILFNRRAHFREYAAASGNTSYQIDVSDRPLSQLANLHSEELPETDVYCVTMPMHSVIVRYNNRVMFTRQSQNFPKKADGYLKEIFGEDHVPPMLRTIVKPPKGWMMMEGDFKQAELFTMANISGDPNMIRLLTTPGLDLHDSTAVSSFNLKMLDEGDKEITEDDLVRLAVDIGAESDEFQHYMKALRYVQVDGSIITRAAFKAGLRISAKSLNFGIP